MADTTCTHCLNAIRRTADSKTVAGLAYHLDCWDRKIRAQTRSAGPVPEHAIRERLGTLIQAGALPSEVPTSVVAVTSATGLGCTGCGTPMEREQLQFQVTTLAGVILHLHRRCLELWVSECPGDKTRD